MSKKFVGLALLLFLGACVCSFNAYAYDRYDRYSRYDHYERGVQGPASKLGRGMSNFGMSILELPKQVYLTAKERDPLTAITYGTVKGTTNMVLRMTEGLYDSLLFAFPPYDEPLMDPEFVFEGWSVDPCARYEQN